jgi:Luciferase-like monooxygenase
LPRSKPQARSALTGNAPCECCCHSSCLIAWCDWVTHHTEMRFSINIPNFGEFADARTVATVAVAAEQAGWDALFVWDHVVHDKRQRRGQPFGDPWMLLTAAALTTSRLRLGTLVTPVAGEGLSSSPARWPPWTHSATEG